MTRILVVIGTPLSDTLSHSLAAAYVDAARSGGSEVQVIDLATDPIPPHPHQRGELRMPRNDGDVALDPDVAASINAVESADHIVTFFPQWWGTYPAAFKAWVDRVLLSGYAFAYRDNNRGWEKRLSGRTARIVMTMDAPRWWNWLMYRDAGVRALKHATFAYCGVKTVGVTRIAEVRHRSREQLESTVASMAALGSADAARTSPCACTGRKIAA